MSQEEFVYLDFIKQYWYVIGGIISLVGSFFTWIWRFRPKASEPSTLTTYIDDILRRRVDQLEVSFNWGNVFFMKKIHLADVPLGSIVTLTIIPPDTIEVPVPRDCFEDKPSKKGRKIFLKNKDYFQNEQVNRVIVLIERLIPIDYRNNIQIGAFSDVIEIQNANSFQVKNYLMPLPENITLDRIGNAYLYVDSVRFDITLPKLLSIVKKDVFHLQKSGITPYLLITTLPPKKGDSVEKVRISLT